MFGTWVGFEVAQGAVVRPGGLADPGLSRASSTPVTDSALRPRLVRRPRPRARRRSCASGSHFALAACDAADEIARAHFRRDLDLERKPDRSFVTVADQDDRARDPGADPARWPDHGLVGEEYGEEAGAVDDPLVHRPHRRHPQLHPRRAAVRDPARGRARRRDAGRRDLGAGDARALVRVPRRRRVGRRTRRASAPDPRLAGRRARGRAAGLRQPPRQRRERARCRASTP